MPNSCKFVSFQVDVDHSVKKARECTPEIENIYRKIQKISLPKPALSPLYIYHITKAHGFHVSRTEVLVLDKNVTWKVDSWDFFREALCSLYSKGEHHMMTNLIRALLYKAHCMNKSSDWMYTKLKFKSFIPNKIPERKPENKVR